jgi:drug/metabolite transporter (DMT)-like permease
MTSLSRLFRPLRRQYLLLGSFAAVYFIWGSTYLAIRYAIQTIPQWGMAASRFLVAGSVMLLLARLRKESPLIAREKKFAALTGVALMSANAVVCYLERWVPSGIAAVVVGAMPIWVLITGKLFFKTENYGLRKWLGALIGLLGIIFIAEGQVDSRLNGFEKYAVFFLLISSWLWAIGTHLQKKAGVIKSSFRYTAWQMLAGAVLVSIVSLIFGEFATFKLNEVSLHSFEAWLYLVIFGSIIAFTAYSWLGRNVEPPLLSTYALVNPVIAVLLGWWIAGESVTLKFFGATALVLLGLSLLLIKPLKKMGHR